MPSILIVDKNPRFTNVLKNYLTLEGHTVSAAHEAQLAIRKALSQPFNAIFLDIDLKEFNGFKVLRSIREKTDIPVIILSSRTSHLDKLVSLELGADDYIVKPCHPYEILAKLKVLLKRFQGLPHHKPVMQWGDLVVDCNRRRVQIKDQVLDLTNTEFTILEILMKTPSQAFSKEELTEYAMGRKFTAYDRSIDVHISNLRNKLGSNSQGEPWIKTVRGFGYQFCAM